MSVNIFLTLNEIIMTVSIVRRLSYALLLCLGQLITIQKRLWDWAVRKTYNIFLLGVRPALVNYVDIFIAAGTKINEPFPTTQFSKWWFHKPLRLDFTDKSGSPLVYVRSKLPLRHSAKHEISSNIQALAFELKFITEKWFFVIICKPTSQNC